MRRTHVMHKRDNRRGFHLANQGRPAVGPCLEWRRTDDGNQQQLFIGGVLYATITAEGEPHIDYDEHGRLIHFQDWKAETENGKTGFFLDVDAARMFCEREYAPAS